ncbi:MULTISPECIES: hypothetical protein [Planktothricoides]|uniref:Uncharacterized protein n=2 Tax=Planktothricoides raciborskii TaxID=132608 RepID=A0AAU8JBI0_9CYAN|nr:MULTISPECIES: hypothetical protein [Planktothricoides]MBD2544923.1 hypothetical protein [Planktothricoides raciborskii FACHB-1370]MBD2582984.1 hypothetical protein [Planktothricoides raciborskii FACHB-1261]
MTGFFVLHNYENCYIEITGKYPRSRSPNRAVRATIKYPHLTIAFDQFLGRNRVRAIASLSPHQPCHRNPVSFLREPGFL